MSDNQISSFKRNGVFVLKTKCDLALFFKGKWVGIPKGFEAAGYPKQEPLAIDGHKMRIFLLLAYLKQKGNDK